MKRLLASLSAAAAVALTAARHTHVGLGMRIAFGHPIAPGRKPSGVRAARRVAAKRRTRSRSH